MCLAHAGKIVLINFHLNDYVVFATSLSILCPAQADGGGLI
jgi:hypothetical protein